MKKYIEQKRSKAADVLFQRQEIKEAKNKSI